jgi:hypothetical protein
MMGVTRAMILILNPINIVFGDFFGILERKPRIAVSAGAGGTSTHTPSRV